MRSSLDPATRGLARALVGLALIPATLAVVAVVPEGARVPAFLFGLAIVVAVAGQGGWLARRAFNVDGSHRARAFAGAAIGLVVAATAGLILLWSTIGLAIG